jgi:hypothetical protein
MNKDSNQQEFDEIYSDHIHWLSVKMTDLVENNRIDDSDALYTEYVVDGEDPDDSLYFTCPRIRNYWEKSSFNEMMQALFDR